LQTLNISACPRIANHSLKQLFAAKQLRTLIVADCHQLEDYGMEYLVHTLPELRSLDLSGCTDIHDGGVKELAKLGQLQTLNIRRCSGVSEAGAKTLADAMPKVKIER
jgi:hypothetical protein